MDKIQRLLEASAVHPEWQTLLAGALSTLDQNYLQQLLDSADWLPGTDSLLAAFRRNRKDVRYLLIGESPYPRRQSANGIAFYDAAVGNLWSESGLSKAVNRATSMRNILKTALRAEGRVLLDSEGKITQENIARTDKRELVQTMAELFDNLHRRGFLLLNATPVLHPERKPAKEAVFWKEFLQKLLALLADSLDQTMTLVLWGKIAESIEVLPAASQYQQLVCEHPYNISFIDNPAILDFFRDLEILRRD